MSNIDTERLESFHLVPVSTQQVGSNVGKKPKTTGKGETETNVVEEPRLSAQ